LSSASTSTTSPRCARRGAHEPDPVWAAVEAHLGGADGITVHLREDRRHIQDEDVRRLRELTHIKLPLEMAATTEMLAFACAVKPEMAMLVPEGREEITTEGGLDVVAHEAALSGAVRRLADAGIVVSVFIDADLRQIEAAARIGARVCEVHTGPYAHAFRTGPRQRARRSSHDSPKSGGRRGDPQAGMRFNAGHALNYFNVQPVAALPGVRELHIGHAIVSRALFSWLARGRTADEGPDPRGGVSASLPRGPVMLGSEGPELTAADRDRCPILSPAARSCSRATTSRLRSWRSSAHRSMRCAIRRS
jgi:pyridoxine 5-phosphate synthase